jgi:hypothetical protein
MTPTLTLDEDRLARLRVALGREARSLRPVPLTLDSEGLRLSLTLPGVDYLAGLLALDGLDAFRRSSALLARPVGSDEEPEPVSLPALADDLREILAGLPDRDDAGETYADLRLAARTSSAAFGEYLLGAVRAYRRDLPAVPTRPTARETAPPARTHADHCRDSRARFRAQEVATIRHVLRRWHETGALTPGSHLARDLFESASSAVERSVAAGRTLPDGSPLADYIGARNFYGVADEVLGPRKRTKRGHVYALSPTTTLLVSGASRSLADEARDEIAASLTSPTPTNPTQEDTCSTD